MSENFEEDGTKFLVFVEGMDLNGGGGLVGACGREDVKQRICNTRAGIWRENRLNVGILTNLADNFRKGVEIKILKYLKVLVDNIKHKRC